jgi:16S rRNA processing protein RimM
MNFGTVMMDVPADLITIGQLRAPYGIQGWLWVYAETDPISNIFAYQPWWIQRAGVWQTVAVKRWRAQGKGLVVLLDGVADRTAAEHMVGTELWISRTQLPRAAANEYYWSDLKGLPVWGIGADGQHDVLLGVVSELFETGANDVMVVCACAGSVDAEERWIPWHSSVIHSVKLPETSASGEVAGRIEVNWGVDY